MRFQPVGTGAAFHRERNGERYYVFHDLLHQGLQGGNFFGKGVEYQFVVNLQHHLAAEPLLPEPPVHPDHRQFDDIGRCPLHGGVHRVPFRKGTDGGVVGMDVRQVPAPSEERLHIAVLAGEGDALVNEGTDGGEGGEVAVDELLGRRS